MEKFEHKRRKEIEKKIDYDTPKYRRIFQQNVGWICKHGVGPRCELGIHHCDNYCQCPHFVGEMRHPEMLGILDNKRGD